MECAMRSIDAASESRRLSSGHGLSSVSIESMVMGLVEAKRKAERDDLPASSRRPAGGLCSCRRLPPRPPGKCFQLRNCR
jgi:hypothetical protein